MLRRVVVPTLLAASALGSGAAPAFAAGGGIELHLNPPVPRMMCEDGGGKFVKAAPREGWMYLCQGGRWDGAPVYG